jgi:CHAT domain-containing protein
LQFLTSPPLNNEAELKSASIEFYDLLIKPVEAVLDRKKQLCIVPDKALNYLPYGAFVSSSSGNYVADEFVLTRSPSATLFIISSENARNRTADVAENLLIVGNPRFDRAAFPMLADLPSAKRESEEIARLYNAPPPFTEDKALKSRVVTEMETADVIHLALHAVVNEHSPLRSKLVFASDRSSAGADTLELSEIYKLHLPQTRLVVLSACQSGAGHYYDGEGMIGISRPFIAKGVPLVVASLWPVDTGATAQLMINFHKSRKSGHSTADALALAQQAMLHGSDSRYRHPYFWAPFVTVGGYARF